MNDDLAETVSFAAEAAVALRFWGKSGGILMQIGGMRTAAYGMRETALIVRHGLGARRAASSWTRAAAEADKKASALSRLCNLPIEGPHHHSTQLLWWAWRDIWPCARRLAIAMSLIGFAMTEKKIRALSFGPQLVSRGGTPERIAAYNARELADLHKEVEKVNKSRADVMARLAKCDASHLVHNEDLIVSASIAGEALDTLMDEYFRASKRSF